MASRENSIQVIDSHTGGEPTRVVISGGPDLGGGPLVERLRRFRDEYDPYRSAIVNEPRGSDVVVGALLVEPGDRSCAAGVIFFNNVGYLGMCGHGMIGLMATLHHLGKADVGEHRIETPVGSVAATLHDANHVSVRNVSSFRSAKNVSVVLEGHGSIEGDIAWGGNWFFLVHEHGQTLDPMNIDQLTAFCWCVRRSLEASGIAAPDGKAIDHIELISDSTTPGIDARNFVLCPGGAYDRSPCGTGTSAKIACLVADGKLKPGEIWRQESIIGSVFEASAQIVDGAIVPTIKGSAYVTGESTLALDPADPFRLGHPSELAMSGRRKSVLIIGGGVAGLCVAYYASREGHKVTVIDRGTAESDRCSNGNAGMIVPSHFIPLAVPGMVRTGLRMMMNPRSPFYIKPRLSWDLLTWGWRFWRAANSAQVARAAPILRELHLASAREYRNLAVANGNRFGLTENGLLMLCKSEHALREESEAAVGANELGIRAEVLDRSQTAAKEPGLKMDVAGSVYFPGDSHLSPQVLMAVLREQLRDAGVNVQWEAEFQSWKFDRRRITSIATSRGVFEAEEFVICAGSWSAQIARAAGLRLPMQAGKGYSLTIPNPICQPRACAILVEARVAVTPMGNALRFGGTMEMAGLDETINPRRVAGIIRAATEYYPQFKSSDFDGIAAWRGLRPCPPDGMPYVGRSRTCENLVVATGHGMMGISLAPITGWLVSDMLAGRPQTIDLTMLSPDRFL